MKACSPLAVKETEREQKADFLQASGSPHLSDHTATSLFYPPNPAAHRQAWLPLPAPISFLYREEFSCWHPRWPPYPMKVTSTGWKISLWKNYSCKVLWIGCWPGVDQRNFSIPIFIYKICNLSLLIETRWYWLSKKLRRVCLGLNRGEPVVIVATHSSIKISNQNEKIKPKSIFPQAHSLRTSWWFEQSLLQP